MNPLELPHLSSFVNDFSGVISEEERVLCDSIFQSHEDSTEEQVVTVFFPHRRGNELLDIGLKLFNENQIGQDGLNNGLLLIIATEEKKIRIVTGKGMEVQYPEMRCRDIIENHLRPLLNKGNYKKLLEVWGNIIQQKIEVQPKEVLPIVLILGFIISIPVAIILSFFLAGYLGIHSLAILVFPIVGLPLFYLGLAILISLKKSRIKIGIFFLLILWGIAGWSFFIFSKTIYCAISESSICIEWRAEQKNTSSSGSIFMQPSSSWNDHSSTSSRGSSSFDGGGGSSNGGGWGD